MASILGYADTTHAISDRCKSPETLKSVETTGLNIPSRGLTIIPERDVYRLIMRSTLPAAL